MYKEFFNELLFLLGVDGLDEVAGADDGAVRDMNPFEGVEVVAEFFDGVFDCFDVVPPFPEQASFHDD